MVTFKLSNIKDRWDRLLEIKGERDRPLEGEFSIDAGKNWGPATIYPGANYDQWRSSGMERWNDGVVKGILPAGNLPCVWNYFFDIDLPCDAALLRLKDAQSGTILLEERVDLQELSSTLIADHRNVMKLAGGKLPGRWAVKANEDFVSGKPSIFLKVESECLILPDAAKTKWWHIKDPDITPLVLNPALKGWYRVYAGMESYSAFRMYFPGQDVWYEVPNSVEPDPNAEAKRPACLKQEFFICSCDMTGQKLSLMAGGSRYWHDVSVRYIRLVPMSTDEVNEYHRLRDLARTHGRPFAGYVESVTTGWYEPSVLTLRDSLHNEMRLNAALGATEVYTHVIRIGCNAWYHSDIVGRFSVRQEDCASDPGAANFTRWMKQGDPLAVAIEESHAAGVDVKVFADAGMNCTYYSADEHYSQMTEKFAKQHPEYLCREWQYLFDYRHPAVQDYVVAVIRELMTKYRVDGVNLDFCRFGFAKAYDVNSLVAVMRRIHQIRCETQEKRGQALTISTRIDYQPPRKPGEEPDAFLEALATWAGEGLIDRVLPSTDGVIKPDVDFSHYRRAVEGTKVAVWADLYWGTWNKKDGGPGRDLAVARHWVANGINGGFHYYMAFRPSEWSLINWPLRLIDYPEVVVDPNFQPAGQEL
jgi:hypothetical protein